MSCGQAGARLRFLKRYSDRKENKICVRCGKNPAREKKVECEGCK